MGRFGFKVAVVLGIAVATTQTASAAVSVDSYHIDVAADGSATLRHRLDVTIHDASSASHLQTVFWPWNSLSGTGEVTKAGFIDAKGTWHKAEVSLLKPSPRPVLDRGYDALFVISLTGLSVGDRLVVDEVVSTRGIGAGGLSIAVDMPRADAQTSPQLTVQAVTPMKLKVEAQGAIAKATSAQEGSRTAWAWTIVDVPVASAPPEPYRGVIVSSLKDYKAVADLYRHNESQNPGASGKAVAALAQTILRSSPGIRPEVALYNWVNANIAYENSPSMAASLSPEALSVAIERKSGDCKVHAALLRALLHAAGIPASSALVNQGPFDKLPDVASFPGPFNHVITYLPATRTFVDSTDAQAPFGVLGLGIQGKHALVVGQQGSELVETPVSGPEVTTSHTETTLQYAPDGTVAGTTDYRQRGVLELVARRALAQTSEADAKTIVARLFAATGVSGKGDWSFTDPRDLNTPLTFKSHFTMAGAVAESGEGHRRVRLSYGAPGPNSIDGLARHATSAGPFPCVGATREEVVQASMPEGFEVVTTPPPTRYANALGSLDVTYRVNGRRVTIQRIHKVFRGSVCGASSVQAWNDLADVTKKSSEGFVELKAVPSGALISDNQKVH